VVSPQTSVGWSIHQLLTLLNEVKLQLPVDASRIYGIGHSLGANALWELTTAVHEVFAALVLVSGSFSLMHSEVVMEVPQWIFHNEDDPIAPKESIEEVAEAMKQMGAKEVLLTVYPPYVFRMPVQRHDAWTETYQNPEIYKWLLQHWRAGSNTEQERNLSYFTVQLGKMGISKRVRVKFVLHFKHLPVLKTLRLIGSVPELGNWDAKDSLELYNNGGGPKWSREVIIPMEEKKIEYRYIVKHQLTSEYDLEGVADRHFILAPSFHVMMLEDVWDVRNSSAE